MVPSVRQGEQTLSITELGAGAQVLAALVVDIVRQMHARFSTLHFAEHAKKLTIEHEGVVLIDEVEAHLDELGRIRGTLHSLLESCLATQEPTGCPVLEGLAAASSDEMSPAEDFTP